MNSNHFIRALPLVASALGRKYGIEVIIGGDRAATNGRCIYLPSLPLDSPSELVAIARSFLDHEAAHIRATNFKQIKAAKLSPLEFHIFNTLEDWRVEKFLGELFPGCRSNFNWLARHFFEKPPEHETTPEQDILNWILVEARSWSVPELRPRAASLHNKLATAAPALIAALDPIMLEVQSNCPDSQAVIIFARRIVAALKGFVRMNCGAEAESSGAPDGTPQPEPGDQPNQPGSSGDDASIISALKSLLAKSADELPADMGQELEKILTAANAEAHEGALLRVARVCPRETEELYPSALTEVRFTTMALKRRMQSLLQAVTLKKVRLGHRGRLDNGSLHKLFIDEPKLFRRSGTRIGLNTAVHLLIDASGSMRCDINFVSTAAYSLCEALSQVPNLSIGATVFPGAETRRSKTQGKSWETVAPILKHGQPLHRKFRLAAQGSTPMGEAIWWALQEMAPLKQTRKVILILTDGEPDYIENTKTAIAEAQRLGYEVYGLGIKDSSVKRFMPGRSTVINQLADLPRAMFELLGTAIIRKENL